MDGLDLMEGFQFAADGIAANALLVTNVAAASGGLGWLLIEWFLQILSQL